MLEQALKLGVNEQNPQAKGFYGHMGFSRRKHEKHYFIYCNEFRRIHC